MGFAMKQTIEKILMTLVIIMIAALMGTMMAGCTSDDDAVEPLSGSDEELYAVIVDPDEQLINITSQDYVLTLNDIAAYNPETGEMKVKGGERISEKAFPTPTQHSIRFYSKGKLLFSAYLNSVLSSMMSGPGLIFEHWWGPDKEGYSRFKLEHIRLIDEKGRVLEGDLSDSDKTGLAQFEQILKNYGRINKNITWNWGNEEGSYSGGENKRIILQSR
jgi:hypothetical protein